jgi:ligand-binding sensor domain-containing protein/signal transduction histidine kinase
MRKDLNFQGMAISAVLAALGWLAVPPAAAARFELPPLRFDHLSVEDGLSQSTVFEILQDRLGYLWFGTEDGLNKFDGYEFTIYRHRENVPASLSDNWISALYEDREGNLWVATRRGIDRLDRASGRFTHLPAPLPEREASCLREDADGNLWLGTDAGLFRFDPETQTFLPIPIDPRRPEEVGVRSILPDRSGALWLATWGLGLVRFDPRHHTLDRIPADVGLERLRVLYEGHDGSLWVGGDERLAVLDRTRGRLAIRTIPGRPYPRVQVTAFFEDDLNHLWVGVWGDGIYVLSPDRTQAIHLRRDAANPASLSHDTAWAIFRDRSGVLWVGSGTGGGLNRLVTRSSFESYRYSPAEPLSLSGDFVWAIHEDADGALWVGTSDGLDRLDRRAGEVQRFHSVPGDPSTLSSQRVWALAKGAGGTLWVGTQGGGLNALDRTTGRVRRISLGDPMGTLGPNDVRALLPGANGDLWIGTHGGGLAWFDPQSGRILRFRHDPHDPRTLCDDRVWALAFDRQGRLWIGTDGGGLDRLDRDSATFLHFRHHPSDPTSLGSDHVWAIHEDRSGSLWLGTQGGGLSRFDPATGRCQRFTESSGLPNDTVYGLLEDDAGHLWLSTNRGIACLEIRTGKVRNFDVGQGLQGNEFNFGAYHRGSDGELFFGGVHGLTAFFPRRVLEPPHQVPPVVITGFSRPGAAASGEVQSVRELRLGPAENFFTFTFAVLDFRNPRRNLYSYKLEGVDSNWRSAAASSRHASYTLVRPGEYVFRVRGASSEGVWNRTGAAVRVIVRPPFWWTPWFLFFVGLLVAGLAVASRAYQKALRAETARMLAESREQERETLAQEIHDGPIQEIAHLAHRIDRLADEEASRPLSRTSLQEGLAALRQELTQMSRRLRDACWSLRPPTLDQFGLEAAMREHLDVLSDSHPLPQIDFQFQPATRPLPPDVELQFFRIFQGAINNAVKHAEANTIRVHFHADEREAVLEVADNGKGFTPPRRLVHLARERHYGLLGIQERATMIGGSMNLDAAPNRGTVVRIAVSLGNWITRIQRQGERHGQNPSADGG